MIPETVRILHAHTETAVELPEFTDLAQRTYVYDAKGNQLAYYQLENSQPVTIDQVPDGVIQAFLAVEDSEFYRHHGVNLRSFVRALLSNVQGSSSRQGASTITQQVVKLEFLVRARTRRPLQAAAGPLRGAARARDARRARSSSAT